MANYMANQKLLTNSSKDLLTPDASGSNIYASYHGQIANSGNGRIGGSDGGSGTMTDQESGIYPNGKFAETRIYPRRWWILWMLCISVIQNSNNWITFSVCFDETHREYGWDKRQVGYLTAWGPLLFIPIALLLPYLNKIFSFRVLMTIANLLMCIGCITRSFPPKKINNDELTLILAHIGQILNAIAAPLVYAIPQQVSAVWFPKEQRTLSTSIAVSAGYAGSLLSYLTVYYIHLNHNHLLHVLLLEAIFSLIFFIIILIDQIWYDDIPPIPPSISSMLSLERHTYSEQGYSFRHEVTLIFKNRKFHYFTIICGAYQGVISGWTGVLSTIFGPDYLGFSETYVALIGISTILAIILSGVIFGVINDALHKRMKLMMIVLLFLSGVFLTIFTMIVNGGEVDFIAKNKSSQWVAIIFCVCGIFSNAGTYGLSYEGAVELIYPSREIFAGTILCIYFNLFSSIFILLNNYLDPLYMNWVIAGIQIISCILLLFYNQEYRRLDYDDAHFRKINKTPKSLKGDGSINNLHRSITPTTKSHHNNNGHQRMYTDTPSTHNNNNSHINSLYHSTKIQRRQDIDIENNDNFDNQSLHSSI